MKVACRCEEIWLENDEGEEVEGIKVTCGHCGRQQEAYGTGRDSVRYCFMKMHKVCDEDHYYVVED